MTAQRLYMAVHVEEAEPLADWEIELLGATAPSDPDGWTEFCDEMWGEYKPFFFPKTGVPYRSRSAAQRRVDIINRWGGKAEVLVCEPVWEPLEVVKKRRERERVTARIKKKQAELNALYYERDGGQAVA